MTTHSQTPVYTLYGIKNCDTMKKARRWLEEQQIDYHFHDYRVDGLSAAQLDIFIQALGWQALLNTRGTTWRKLPEGQRNAVTSAETAAPLMLEQPALIKRPLLWHSAQHCLLGFKPDMYAEFFSQEEV